MTDPKQPHENSGNATTVHNPNAPGRVERTNPSTGGSAGTVDTDKTDE